MDLPTGTLAAATALTAALLMTVTGGAEAADAAPDPR